MKKSSAGVKRILVVEDEPAISQICQRVLGGEGFEVDSAINGRAAQEMLGKKDYDLALIDLRTPIMNGKELYCWIMEKHPRLVNGVIFTTGDLLGGDTNSFLEQTERLLLPKPFTPQELKAVVREALKGVDNVLDTRHRGRYHEQVLPQRKMMVKTRILVVDDEVNIVRFVRANLEASGYQVFTAGDGLEALQTFERELPDLVILDLRMPKMDGFEVCRRIREWSQTLIIVLTALGSEEDKIKCFNLGADDYVTKPFSKNELLARVKGLLRRTTLWDERPEPALHFHDLVIDFAQHRVTLDSQDVKLTATEYRLLFYLARNAGRVITPGQILEKVWGDEYVGETYLLQVVMARLRQKLGDDPKEPRFIETRIGIGYMFLKPS